VSVYCKLAVHIINKFIAIFFFFFFADSTVQESVQSHVLFRILHNATVELCQLQSGLLLEKKCSEDRSTYDFDVRKINWESYMESYVSGVRKYLLKEDSSTLNFRKSNLKM
jgi:hypothetical protein